MPMSVVRERLGLRALRVSRWVRERLAEPEPLGAVVHSVFRRAANLRLDVGDMLSLSAPEVALAPNGVAIELPVDVTMGAVGIQPGQSATLSPVWLRISGMDVEVTFAGATPWEPRPRAFGVAPSALARRALGARGVVIAEGATGSLLPLLRALDSDGGAERRDFALAARRFAWLLCDAAARYDAGAVQHASSRLAGLGPGLTPSGDDFLAGFAAAWTLTAEALGLPPYESARVLNGILAGGLAGASELGAQWLTHGVRGEVAEPMGRFFTALLAAEPGPLAPGVRGVLALGATSGTDWLVGALLGTDAALATDARERSWRC